MASAFVPLTFAPGEAYQFDWSHVIVVLNGVTTKAQSAARALRTPDGRCARQIARPRARGALGLGLTRRSRGAGRASDRRCQRGPLFLVERDHRRPGLRKFVPAEFLEALLIVMVKPTNVRRRELGRIDRHLFRGGEPARPVRF